MDMANYHTQLHHLPRKDRGPSNKVPLSHEAFRVSNTCLVDFGLLPHSTGELSVGFPRMGFESTQPTGLGQLGLCVLDVL
jgi:hypothetical protein